MPDAAAIRASLHNDGDRLDLLAGSIESICQARPLSRLTTDCRC